MALIGSANSPHTESRATRTPELLRGIRLFELGDLGASFCGKLLADLGAEVIKVERPVPRPQAGGMPPPKNPTLPARGTPWFTYNNRNKSSITLDLGKLPGRELFLRLCAHVDGVLESLAPGTMERLGLGPEVLTGVNPQIVHGSITGFGSSGPLRNWRSCDLIAAASGGQLLVNGSPGRPPLQLPGAQAVYLGSLNAALGLVLALLRRRTSGRGSYVEVSLQEAVASGLDHVLVQYFAGGTVAGRTEDWYWNQSVFVAPCKDGYIAIYPFNQWDTLVEWMGSENMAADLADPRFREPQYRRDCLSHIVQVISRWTATHTRAELAELGQLMGFPWAAVCRPEEVLASPHLVERKFFAPLEEVNGGGKVPRAPYRFLGGRPLRGEGAVPEAGERNRKTYREELGLTDEEFQSLARQGVI